jgi:hypothetical protein
MQEADKNDTHTLTNGVSFPWLYDKWYDLPDDQIVNSGPANSPEWRQKPVWIQSFEQNDLVYVAQHSCIPLVQLVDGPGWDSACGSLGLDGLGVSGLGLGGLGVDGPGVS